MIVSSQNSGFQLYDELTEFIDHSSGNLIKSLIIILNKMDNVSV